MSKANPTPREIAKRKQILAAARELFLTRGYAGTSMDLVTSEAGISKQTLYRYYAAKEALFSDVLREVIHELTDAKEPSLSDLPVPENRGQLYDRLLMMAQVISLKTIDPQYLSLVRVVFAEAVRFPELGDLFRETIPRSTGVLSNMLRICARNGLVKLADEDLDMSINMFIGPLIAHSLFHGMLEQASGPEPMPRRSLEQLCRMYTNFIA